MSLKYQGAWKYWKYFVSYIGIVLLVVAVKGTLKSAIVATTPLPAGGTGGLPLCDFMALGLLVHWALTLEVVLCTEYSVLAGETRADSLTGASRATRQRLTAQMSIFG